MDMPLGAYGRPSVGLPTIRAVNLFVEQTKEGPTPAARIPRPGLTLVYNLGAPDNIPFGNVVRMYQNPGLFNGDLFSICGASLFRNAAFLGSVPYSTQPRMAAIAGKLAIVAGGALYVYNGSTLTLIRYFDDGSTLLPKFSGVAVLYNIFIFPVAGSDQFYWSSVGDPSTINALDTANAQTSPDPIIEVAVLAEELYFFKSKATEIWDYSPITDPTTGAITQPFALSQGRTYIRGTPAQGSVALLDNALFWVGDNFTVYRTSAAPLRVSTPYIEDLLRQTTPSQITAFNVAIEGHDFYVLNMPSINQSYAYDCQTQEWAQWGSHQNYVTDPGLLKVSSTTGQGTQLYAGSAIDNRVWVWDSTNPLDDDSAIRKTATSVFWTTAGKLRLNNVGLACVRGVGNDFDPNPTVDLRLSYDGGRTFTSWMSEPLGERGAYDIKAVWRSLGLISQPGVVCEFSTTANVIFAPEGVSYNESRY